MAMASSSIFFWRSFVSLVKFSYRSKFLVHVATGSEVMIIFFYKRLARNPGIANTPVWVLPSIWRLGQVSDTKFGTNVSNKMLLNAAKFQGYSFYLFWGIKKKPTEGRVKITSPCLRPPRIRQRFVVKNPLRLYWEKNMFNSLLGFYF